MKRILEIVIAVAILAALYKLHSFAADWYIRYQGDRRAADTLPFLAFDLVLILAAIALIMQGPALWVLIERRRHRHALERHEADQAQAGQDEANRLKWEAWRRKDR